MICDEECAKASMSNQKMLVVASVYATGYATSCARCETRSFIFFVGDGMREQCGIVETKRVMSKIVMIISVEARCFKRV